MDALLPRESEPASELAGVRFPRELARLPLYQPPSQPSTAQHARARADQSRAKQSRAEQSRPEQSRAEQSRAEQSRVEQSRAEQSRAEQNRAEQSRAEQSKAFPNGCSLGCLTGCHESKTYGWLQPGSRDSSRSG